MVPSVASAGTLTFPPAACLEQGSFINASGTGFTANASIELVDSAGLSGHAFPDESGAVPEYEVRVTESSSFVPKTFSLSAIDQANPGNNTSVSAPFVRFGSNLPVIGKPTAKVTWQFAGFPTGATIYGHFRFNNKKVKDVRFGTAKGPCGTLSKKTQRVPVDRPKRGPGGWYVQVDTKPKFSANTRPEYDETW